MTALRLGDLARLGQAMNENQALLRTLDVSCEEIEHVCQLALAAGALGAKLTGGGGGGCVVALAPGREQEVRSAWQAAGYSSFLVEVGGDASQSAPSPSLSPLQQAKPVMHAVATANTNIALVKYWGDRKSVV